MHYRRFGRTGLAMPVFTCGGMRYQFKWQDVAPSEVPPDNQANLEATIRRAEGDSAGALSLARRALALFEELGTLDEPARVRAWLTSASAAG